MEPNLDGILDLVNVACKVCDSSVAKTPSPQTGDIIELPTPGPWGFVFTAVFNGQVDDSVLTVRPPLTRIIKRNPQCWFTPMVESVFKRTHVWSSRDLGQRLFSWQCLNSGLHWKTTNPQRFPTWNHERFLRRNRQIFCSQEHNV